MELSGKVAVVTGASSGIGEAAARALAADGMSVVAVARRRDRLQALASTTPRVRPFGADVTSDDDVDGLAEWVADELGACHVLVNGAGVNAGKAFRGRADLEALHQVMGVNFFGAARCMAVFAELLAESRPSRVINVASVAGKVPAGLGAYGASKFALVGLSEHTRGRWQRRGIAVCQLNPGFVRTEGFPQKELMRSPLRRLVAGPETVADAIMGQARSGAAERTVPRWYRPVVVLRHLAPPVVRAATARL